MNKNKSYERISYYLIVSFVDDDLSCLLLYDCFDSSVKCDNPVSSASSRKYVVCLSKSHGKFFLCSLYHVCQSLSLLISYSVLHARAA